MFGYHVLNKNPCPPSGSTGSMAGGAEGVIKCAQTELANRALVEEGAMALPLSTLTSPSPQRSL